MLRLLPRESERSGAQARYTRKPPHQVRARAGTWEHGLAPKKGGFSLVQRPSIAHGASAASAARRARASEARVLRLLPRESERSGAQARYTRKPPHQVRARAGTWEHGLAPKKGGFSLVQRPFIAHGASAASAARRARASEARVLRLLPRESERSGAQARYTRNPPHQVRARAGTWEHGLAPKKGGFSLVQRPSIAHGASAASAARRARASEAHVLRLLPTESERSGAQARYTRKPPHQVRARAGTWEHGLAPKKGGFSLVQRPSIAHGASAASAARRARASEAHVLRLLPRESERSGAQARYTRKPPHQVRARAGTWEHGLAPKKGGFSFVQRPSKAQGASAASVGTPKGSVPTRLPKALGWRIEISLDMQIRAKLLQRTLGGGGNRGLL